VNAVPQPPHGMHRNGSVPVRLKGKVLEELGRVLNSPDFRGSRRGQAVLRYLVDNALAEGSDPVKERTVGVELFSREPD